MTATGEHSQLEATKASITNTQLQNGEENKETNNSVQTLYYICRAILKMTELVQYCKLTISLGHLGSETFIFNI